MLRYLDTHWLFKQLTHFVRPDIIMDIGSRDGQEALGFHRLCPLSTVIAYEANPYQFRKMTLDSSLTGRVQIRNAAVSSFLGQSHFYVAKADYDSPESTQNNLGQSSLMVGRVDTQEIIKIETTTIDHELEKALPNRNGACALWIDVEGAECEVFKGINKHKEHVALIHVECATRPRWTGQESMNALGKLLGNSFVNLGHTSTIWRGWGDAIFLSRSVLRKHSGEVARLRGQARRRWNRYIWQRLRSKLAGTS